MEGSSPGTRRTTTGNPGAATEPDLARAASTGDPRAQRLLLEGLLERVRVTVRYLSGDHRDQEDWVQLALLEILAAAGSFRGESSLAVWADRIAVRCAMRQLKLRRNRDARVVLDPADGTPPPEALARDEHQRLALRRRLAVHLGALKPELRAAVVLKLVHGYSVGEIAGMTDLPPNTVRDRLARGRQLLRRRLAIDPVFENLVPRRHP